MVGTQDFVLAKQVLYCLNHTSCPFCSSYFGSGVSRTIFEDWLQTAVLPISASQVAGIIGVSTRAYLSILIVSSKREKKWMHVLYDIGDIETED
jgi:hypothetical protein